LPGILRQVSIEGEAISRPVSNRPRSICPHLPARSDPRVPRGWFQGRAADSFSPWTHKQILRDTALRFSPKPRRRNPAPDESAPDTTREFQRSGFARARGNFRFHNFHKQRSGSARHPSGGTKWPVSAVSAISPPSFPRADSLKGTSHAKPVAPEASIRPSWLNFDRSRTRLPKRFSLAYNSAGSNRPRKFHLSRQGTLVTHRSTPIPTAHTARSTKTESRFHPVFAENLFSRNPVPYGASASVASDSVV
jgi:hypothetical protein